MSRFAKRELLPVRAYSRGLRSTVDNKPFVPMTDTNVPCLGQIHSLGKNLDTESSVLDCRASK